MKHAKWLLVAVTLAGLSIAGARAAADGKSMTVGQFALELSRALGQHPADQAGAVAALKKAGVDLGKDLGATLTDRQAAAILRSLGIRVSDAKSGEVSPAKARQILAVIALHGGWWSSDGHGHGHGPDGHRDCHASTADPEDCKDHGHDGDHDGGHDGDHDGEDDHDGDHGDDDD